MDELDLLGLGDQARDLAPALPRVRMFFDEHSTEFSYGPGRAAHCLRRSGLDGRLQFAAVEAGTTLMSKTRVVGVVRDSEDRVCGVDVRYVIPNDRPDPALLFHPTCDVMPVLREKLKAATPPPLPSDQTIRFRS